MTVEQRLARLEKQVRRYSMVAVVLVLAMIAAVTMRQTAYGEVDVDVVKCRELVIQNKQGQTVATGTSGARGEGMFTIRSATGGEIVAYLGAGKDGQGTVRVASSDGVPHGGLASTKDGGVLFISGNNGVPTTSILNNDRGGQIVMFTPSEMGLQSVMADMKSALEDTSRLKVLLSAEPNGGILRIFSANGQQVITLGTTENGSALLATQSAAGKALVALSEGPNESGSVIIFSEGKPSLFLGNGALVATAATGESLVSLGGNENGGMLLVSNKAGKPVCSMQVDDYGNGVVGAWNRKGEGRTLNSK